MKSHSRLLPLALACCSCVGLSHTSSAPSSLLDPSQPRAEEPIVSIAATGVSPGQLHLNAPVTVTFKNLDGTAHTIADAPQLGYGACPEVARVGTIPAGGSVDVKLTTTQFICGYADAAQSGNPAFQGLIVLH